MPINLDKLIVTFRIIACISFVILCILKSFPKFDITTKDVIISLLMVILSFLPVITK